MAIFCAAFVRQRDSLDLTAFDSAEQYGTVQLRGHRVTNNFTVRSRGLQRS